jgi:hypothetical protein
MNCARCESPLEIGDLRCAICAEATPATPETATNVLVQILRCAGCGAAVSYDAETQAPRCGFCDSVMELEEIVDPDEQTGRHLPFTVDTDTARAAVRNWLGSLGWFRPADLRTEARLESIRPLFWVAWVFDAEALISWTADSNAGARRSSWAPHAGQAEMVFDDILVPATRGLTDDEAYHLTPSYDISSRVSGPPSTDAESGPRNPVVEHFEVQRSQARARIVEAIDDIAADRVEHDHVPGNRARKVKTVALLRRLVTRRFAMPSYVLAYRYKERLYRVIVSGQDASCIRGAAPYSILKILLVILLGIGLVVGVVAVLVQR